MKLITAEIASKLRKNGEVNAAHIAKDGNTVDFFPVVKLFTPWAGATWLLTEVDPENPDIAFGLCDLGLGEPEIGSVSLSEITSLTGPVGLRVERDMYFTAKKTLTSYADEARAKGRITA